MIELDYVDDGAIACATLIAKAPGGMRADPRDLPWKHLRPDMRIAPLGPVFSAARQEREGTRHRSA